jgi:hypothetical protein
MAAAAVERVKVLGGWSTYGEKYSKFLVAINNARGRVGYNDCLL